MFHQCSDGSETATRSLDHNSQINTGTCYRQAQCLAIRAFCLSCRVNFYHVPKFIWNKELGSHLSYSPSVYVCLQFSMSFSILF